MDNVAKTVIPVTLFKSINVLSINKIHDQEYKKLAQLL